MDVSVSYAFPSCERCGEHGMVPWFDGDESCFYCGYVKYAHPPMAYVGNLMGPRIKVLPTCRI